MTVAKISVQAMDAGGYQIEPIPRERAVIVDGLAVGASRHMVHALLEIDVTRARRILAARRGATGEGLSFTAFVVAAAARAIAEHRHLNAYRDWRNRLVVFDDVDVATLVEFEAGRVAVPHVIRAANRKSVQEVHDEIRAVQARPARSAQHGGWTQRLAPRIPGFLRRFFLCVLRRCPLRLRRLAGTAVVTAVGMFAGRGAGWAIGIVPLHTLGLTLGGIVERPAMEEGRIVTRELLAVTVSVDHDIVDGAPAARFVRRLRELIEAADGLESPERDAQAQTTHGTPGPTQDLRAH
jgi:pyruvate/2-oxoglutarate dehydrogenase complex dihydrolipoamide acyltransferase (E2) component